MKKYITIPLLFLLFVSWSACDQSDQDTSPPEQSQAPEESEESTDKPSASDTTSAGSDKHNLVLFCSRSGNTRQVACLIQNQLNCHIMEINPEKPYDDDYTSMLDRAREELANIQQGIFPTLSAHSIDLNEYDTLFIGYPIWFGSMATPMQAFLHLHSRELSGKHIALFATSGSSGISQSQTEATSLCPQAEFLDQPLLLTASDLPQAEDLIDSWINEIFHQKEDNNNENIMNSNQIKLSIGQNTFTATLADNPATEALKARLSQGCINIQMNDYGNMEKVGSLGFSLPRTDRSMTTSAGDIVLYQGNSIVIFYGSNSWSYTPLGKVDGISTREEMLKLLGTDSRITVTLSLE